MKIFDRGYISLHRAILNWEWYQDIATTKLFIHCLLRASFSASKWQGIIIKRGQFVSSYESLSKESGLTVRQVRTSINRLETSGCVTRSKYPKYTVFTVLKYIEYQETAGKMSRQGQAYDKVSTGERQQYNKNNKNNNITSTTLPSLEMGSEGEKIYINQANEFYNLYPKKQGKESVINFFEDKKFNSQQFEWITRVLRDDIESENWKKENGKYIPKAINWLKDEKYQRELKPKKKVRVFSDDPYPQE